MQSLKMSEVYWFIGILVAFHRESLCDWKDRERKKKKVSFPKRKKQTSEISYFIVLYIYYVVWYNYINDTFTKSSNFVLKYPWYI